MLCFSFSKKITILVEREGKGDENGEKDNDELSPRPEGLRIDPREADHDCGDGVSGDDVVCDHS